MGVTARMSVVYRAAVANRLHDDDAALGVQFTNDAIVSHAIAPQAEFVVPQGFTELPRIGAGRDPTFHVLQISAAAELPSFCKCRRAAGLYSMVKPKRFAHLIARESRTAFRNGLFGQVAVLKIFYMAFNKLARNIALGSSGALCELGQTPFDVRIKQYVKHWSDLSQCLPHLELFRNQRPRKCWHPVVACKHRGGDGRHLCSRPVAPPLYQHSRFVTCCALP
jgi:hypothetical protein